MPRNKGHKHFIERFNKIAGEEYTVLNEYINSQTKVLVRHNVCNAEYEVRPNSFFQGQRCKSCKDRERSTSQRKTHEQFVEEINDRFGNKYTFLSRYKTKMIKVKVRYNSCGHEKEVLPQHILNGNECKICSAKNVGKKISKSHEEFAKDIYKLAGDEYTLKTNYVNARTDVILRHSICGSYYKVRPSHFLSGSRCTVCAESKGEQVVRKYLSERGVKFEPQYKFKGLVGLSGKPLRVDFAILNDNGEVSLVIEYDGEFHFEAILGEEHLKVQEFRDELKNEYFTSNKIPFIRIKYTEFDRIKEILDEEFETHTLV